MSQTAKFRPQMPEKWLWGNVGLRYNTGSDEKLASAGVTVGLGDQVALRVEGSNVKPMIILHLIISMKAKKNVVSIILCQRANYKCGSIVDL